MPQYSIPVVLKLQRIEGGVVILATVNGHAVPDLSAMELGDTRTIYVQFEAGAAKTPRLRSLIRKD